MRRIQLEAVAFDRPVLVTPEQARQVNAAVISTDEHLHGDPTLAGVERGIPIRMIRPGSRRWSSPARTPWTWSCG